MPPVRPKRVLLRRLPGEPDSVAATRALLGDVVPDPRQLEFLQIAVTELVTNAIVHGPGGPVDLRVARDGESVRVEVADAGTDRFDPLGTEPSLEGDGGHGLHMVDALASDWGGRLAAEHRRVGRGRPRRLSDR